MAYLLDTVPTSYPDHSIAILSGEKGFFETLAGDLWVKLLKIDGFNLGCLEFDIFFRKDLKRARAGDLPSYPILNLLRPILLSRWKHFR